MATYKEYVERKQQEGEEPLSKEDWEARVHGGESGGEASDDEPDKEIAIKLEGAATMTSPKVQAAGKKAQEELGKLIGKEKADAFIAEKQQRDGDAFHITVFSPAETRKIIDDLAKKAQEADKSLSKSKAKDVAKAQFKEKLQSAEKAGDWKLQGIGHAEKEGNEAYFGVIDWPGGKKLRETFGLDPNAQDFHTTLGFKGGDVHGVKKDKSTLVKNAASRIVDRYLTMAW